ncbi:energy transducer TonB [Undibacterium sp. Di27W]|uniref:energy transducer TonB n=1 Tax=Undibacterium sp. Di27W TaxID=3413036 RepID=UPI003BF2A921
MKKISQTILLTVATLCACADNFAADEQLSPKSNQAMKPDSPVFPKAQVRAFRANSKDCHITYPPEAVSNNATGTTRMQLLIEIDGSVVDKKIYASSGFRILDSAALDGIGKCRFAPTIKDGKPERAWAYIKYRWNLDED